MSVHRIDEVWDQRGRGRGQRFVRVHRRLTAICIAVAVAAGSSIAIAGAIAGRPSGVKAASTSATKASAPNKLAPPPVPGANHAYLGVDANFGKGSTGDQVQAFEHMMGGAVGIASFYVAFLQMPPLAQMHAVYKTGAIPMLNMKCGASDASVAAGQWDRQLRKLAVDLRSFKSPVFFRWFWEMNLPKANSHAACLAGHGGGGYIAAYHHIWNIFHSVGAKNVSFVWAPSDAGHVPHSADLTFWPGASYVDWIGADLYDRQQVHKTFGHEFDAFYRFWHAAEPSKPIILSETGAVGTAAQVTWLQQITACLTRKVHMTRETPYTQVKAIIYVDAVDKFSYVLKPGTAGHKTYASMLHLAFFHARG